MPGYHKYGKASSTKKSKAKKTVKKPMVRRKARR